MSQATEWVNCEGRVRYQPTTVDNVRFWVVGGPLGTFKNWYEFLPPPGSQPVLYGSERKAKRKARRYENRRYKRTWRESTPVTGDERRRG